MTASMFFSLMLSNKRVSVSRAAADEHLNVSQRDTHYCRLTPNCCVGRGGRGGGVFAGGGGRPF